MTKTFNIKITENDSTVKESAFRFSWQMTFLGYSDLELQIKAVESFLEKLKEENRIETFNKSLQVEGKI
jgi:hypothetical protein